MMPPVEPKWPIDGQGLELRGTTGYRVPMNLLTAVSRRVRQQPESLLLVVGLAWVVWAVVELSGSTGMIVGPSSNLIQGLIPSEARLVTRTEVIADGVRARHGDDWDTDLTAVFHRPGFVTYDLGQVRDIRGAYVQGDANDDYVFATSEDGSRFDTVWSSGAAKGVGVQPRSITSLNARARYIRISGRGGDGKYSIAEAQIFEQVPAEVPAGLTVRSGLPTGERVRGHLLHFALAMGVFLFASRRGSPWWWKLVSLAAPLAAGAIALGSFLDAWPVDQSEVSMARAISAAIAVFAVLREAIAPKSFPASRASVAVALSAAAVLAFASFYNLGHLQFKDHANDRQTFVHTYDMRVYYPVAKYFPELRFDGLYLASVAAMVDDVPGTTRAKLANVQFRDLKTHRMVKADDVWNDIEAVKKRFSPERWDEFVRDMRYLRLTMGPDYLGSMVDHGGNATPVWLASMYLVFNQTEASETTLVIGGLMDPLLLILALIAIGWAYGWRASLLCAVIFGANDFVMLGSNWAGATLRHDWLAYLMMTVAALKKEKYVAGGVLLAMSSAARAFPALALVGMAFPVLFWLAEYHRQNGRWPGKAEWMAAKGNTLRAWMGAAAGGVALFLFASIVLSFSAWPEWLRKVRLLDSEPHVNMVSLEGLVAGTEYSQAALLDTRQLIFWTIAGAFAVGIALAARRRSPDQAAILGCMFIPILFNPANYYIHFITILPLLAWTAPRSEPTEGQTWDQAIIGFAILGLCIAQYWTTKVHDRTIHFEMATALLFASFALMLMACWRGDRQLAVAGLPMAEVTPPSHSDPPRDSSPSEAKNEDARS